MKALTPKQEMFCQEYLVDLNATQAAIRAGYSRKTAGQQAEALLKKLEIATRVQELMDSRSQKVSVSSETVLQELLRLATVDLSEAYDENGNLKQIHDIPVDVRRAIAGVETYYEKVGSDEDGNPDLCTVKKLKFWDKTKALEMLGRHLKLFTDKVEHSGTVNLADRLARFRKK